MVRPHLEHCLHDGLCYRNRPHTFIANGVVDKEKKGNTSRYRMTLVCPKCKVTQTYSKWYSSRSDCVNSEMKKPIIIETITYSGAKLPKVEC